MEGPENVFPPYNVDEREIVGNILDEEIRKATLPQLKRLVLFMHYHTKVEVPQEILELLKEDD